jgi:hypothetical protein
MLQFRASTYAGLLAITFGCSGSDPKPPEDAILDAGPIEAAAGGTGGVGGEMSAGGQPMGGTGGAGGDPAVPDAGPVETDASPDASEPPDAAVEAAPPPPDAGPCADGLQGPGEEGIDCGFLTCQRACAGGPACSSDGDCGSGVCDDGHCASPLTGAVSGDLVLDAAGSPYVLTDDVQISGALSIDPGVVLDGAGHSIRALDVSVVGTATDRIALQDVTLDAGSEMAATVSDVTFRFVDVFGGSLMLVAGYARYYHFEMTDCRVRSSEELYLWFPHGQTVVERNVFVDTAGLAIGLNQANESASARIASNYFEGMTPPQGDVGFIGLWASVGSATLTVELNTFADAGVPAVSLRNDASNMVATGNYWSTTDEFVIRQMIWDKNDNGTLAASIPYSPFLTAPDPSAPTREGYPVPGPAEAGADAAPIADAASDAGIVADAAPSTQHDD